MWFRDILNRNKRSGPGTAMATSKAKRPSSLPLPLVRQLERLRLRGSRELRGAGIGGRSSYYRKLSAEFSGHRVYVPGDDLRFVDWRASSRQEKVFVRQGELPKSVVVYLMLDCSASMRWGDGGKAWMQKMLALTLGYTALCQGDRVYIHPYGSGVYPDLGPISGKGQFTQLAQYLNQIEYFGQASLTNGLEHMNRQISRSGILFILSDLLERGEITQALAGVPAPLWWVTVLHILHPLELAPDLQGSLELEDQETGQRANFDINQEALKNYTARISQWRNTLEMACVENHALYAPIDSSLSLETEVVPYLRSVKVLEDR